MKYMLTIAVAILIPFLLIAFVVMFAAWLIFCFLDEVIYK